MMKSCRVAVVVLALALVSQGAPTPGDRSDGDKPAAEKAAGDKPAGDKKDAKPPSASGTSGTRSLGAPAGSPSSTPSSGSVPSAASELLPVIAAAVAQYLNQFPQTNAGITQALSALLNAAPSPSQAASNVAQALQNMAANPYGAGSGASGYGSLGGYGPFQIIPTPFGPRFVSLPSSSSSPYTTSGSMGNSNTGGFYGMTGGATDVATGLLDNANTILGLRANGLLGGSRILGSGSETERRSLTQQYNPLGGYGGYGGNDGGSGLFSSILGGGGNGGGVLGGFFG